MSCDYDEPSFYNSKDVRAQKEHKCVECGGTINIGEKYEYVVGAWVGELRVYKTCSDCLGLRDILSNSPYYCLSHGDLVGVFMGNIEDNLDIIDIDDFTHRVGWIAEEVRERMNNEKDYRTTKRDRQNNKEARGAIRLTAP